MIKGLLFSLSQLFLAIFFITLLNFTLLYCGTGNPLAALQNAVEEHGDIGQEKVLKQEYGLDQPYWLQYVLWLGNLFQGDLGVSYLQNRSVIEVIKERLWPTLLLIGTAFPLGLLLALFLGIGSAVLRDSLLDRIISLGNFLVLSTPSFLLSLFLLQIFSLHLNWLPTGGMTPLGSQSAWSLSHLILPASVLVIYYANSLLALVRKTMVEVLNQNYIRTAYACGLSIYRIIFIYALKNALLPLLTLVVMSLPRFFTGAFVVEYIFSWPGMGRLIVESGFQRDYPVLMAIVLVLSILVVFSNFLAQFLYHLVDPRIKYSQTYRRED